MKINPRSSHVSNEKSQMMQEGHLVHSTTSADFVQFGIHQQDLALRADDLLGAKGRDSRLKEGTRRPIESSLKTGRGTKRPKENTV